MSDTTTIPEYCTTTGRGYSAVLKAIKSNGLQHVGMGGRNNSAKVYRTADLDRVFTEREDRLERTQSLLSTEAAVDYTGYCRAYLIATFQPALIIGKARYYSPDDLDAKLRIDKKTPNAPQAITQCRCCEVNMAKAPRGVNGYCGWCVRDLLRGKKLQLATAGV